MCWFYCGVTVMIGESVRMCHVADSMGMFEFRYAWLVLCGWPFAVGGDTCLLVYMKYVGHDFVTLNPARSRVCGPKVP